mmetsp:Transcript_12225/g.36323  ORF Transcript_12225/g.36323 Transcript_12225/m.36323 type:complete len:208 (+) Transcript_12225:580-1203(+)
MSAHVDAITQPAKRKKPMHEVASPVAVHCARVPMHRHKLTSARARSSRWRASASASTEPRSMRSDMLGSVRPAARRGTKAATSAATTQACAPRLLAPPQDLVVASTPSGSGGISTPRAATVELTQKTAKQEKPMSIRTTASSSGGWSRLRSRKRSRTYANMSGAAHLEIACSARTQSLARITCVGVPRRQKPASARSTSFAAGMTMA